MRKVAIIGGSVAGLSLALMLSEKLEVTIYELRPQNKVGLKLCSNICTEPVKEILEDWGLSSSKYIKKTYKFLKIFTRKNFISFPIREYEINRAKLVEDLIKKLKKRGVKFNFSSKFVDYKLRSDGEYELIYDKLHKRKSKVFDIIVGADGAVSEFARKMGCWNNRKHFLYLQSKVSKKQISKKFSPAHNTQFVFVGKDFGYYSYVYPSGQGYSVGFGKKIDKNIGISFNHFTKYLGIKNSKINGALIPLPKLIGFRKNLFVMGDAACETKFSLGGIVPSFMSAYALRDIILKKSFFRYFILKFRLGIHQIATHILNNLDEKDFENLFDIMDQKKFRNLMAHRDRFSFKDFFVLFSPSLVWFSIKHLF